MIEVPLTAELDLRLTKEFKCHAWTNVDTWRGYWTSEFLQYLKDTFNARYWERDIQYGGPCFVFEDQEDYTMFALKFL